MGGIIVGQRSVLTRRSLPASGFAAVLGSRLLPPDSRNAPPVSRPTRTMRTQRVPGSAPIPAVGGSRRLSPGCRSACGVWVDVGSGPSDRHRPVPAGHPPAFGPVHWPLSRFRGRDRGGTRDASVRNRPRRDIPPAPFPAGRRGASGPHHDPDSGVKMTCTLCCEPSATHVIATMRPASETSENE